MKEFFISSAEAAADPVITGATESVSTVITENVIAAIDVITPILLVGAVLILIVLVAFRTGKKMITEIPGPATDDDFDRAFERDYPDLASKWGGYKH